VSKMNDFLLLIIALPPAILSFIHLIKIIKFRSFYRNMNKKDGDLENNHNTDDQRMKLTEIRHSKNSLILYLLYIALVIIVTLNIVNTRSDKIFKGYELTKLREELSQLDEEINLIRAENALILSEEIEDLIRVEK